MKDIDGADVDLSAYKGKVLLVVNTATHCGHTKQYNGLETLYEKYKGKGFEILDFPCNQFLHQAPEDEAGIKSICQLKYNVSFKQFSKINVNGKDAHPLYEYLKSEKQGESGARIKWNFTKFLIDREGNVVARFEPKDTPESIENKIVELL